MARRRSGPRCQIGKGAASIRPDRASRAAARRPAALAKLRHLLLALGRVGQPEEDGAGGIGRRRRAAADPVDPRGAGGAEREGEAPRRRGAARHLRLEQRAPYRPRRTPRRGRPAVSGTSARPRASATRSASSSRPSRWTTSGSAGDAASSASWWRVASIRPAASRDRGRGRERSPRRRAPARRPDTSAIAASIVGERFSIEAPL